MMKHLKFLVLFALTVIFMTNCDEEEDPIPEIVAGFTYTVDDDQGNVTFVNTSENATSYAWNFGDGTTSTEINPTHQFASGTYTVQLTASNDFNQSKSVSDEVTIQVVGPIIVPFNFDDASVDYSAEVFGGASFEVVDNPDQSGSNAVASKVGAITNSGAEFEGIFFTLGEAIDLTTQKSIAMNFWANAPIDVLLKLEKSTGEAVETSVGHGGSGWEEIIFDFTSADQFTIFTLFADGPGTTAGTFYFDDVEQRETVVTEPEFDSGLLTNGDFEDGGTAWSGNALNVQEDGGNSFNLADVQAAGNAFDVNLSQVVELEQGKTYTLSFDASSDRERTILAGIGLNVDPFTASTETVNLTTETQTFTFTFTATDFGGADSRVLFDMGAEVGVVVIDNVSLKEDTSSGGGSGEPFDSGLLTNGDFENGDSPWFGNALQVREEGGNSFNFADVQTAGNAFDVNLSQVVEIVQGTTYTLTFDASSDRERTMIAGIGLNEAPFTAATETVNLTTETQTFTLTLTAADFGLANSRVLFDMGADVGVVVIDNVSLKEDTSGGGGGGEPGEVDEFCNTSVLHFGGDAASEILVSIFNVDAQTMRIEVASANDDPVDALVLPAGDWSPVPGIAVAPNDTDEDGTWTADFFYPEGAPTTVNLYFLWSKVSFEGNWQSHNFGAGETATVAFDATCDGGGGGQPFDDGLLTNGDFEGGATAWSGNAFNISEDGGNSFNLADVQAAGNAFDVNLSQVVEITQGTTYTLTFDASSDRARTMIAGIGLNVDPFTSATETVNLTTETQTFTLTLAATDFGGANSRVLFDMGAEVGVVVIDNVSLREDTSGGGSGGGGTSATAQIAVNGDFEANDGDGSSWLFFANGGTAEIDNAVFNGGAYSAKLATNGASNPGIKQERVGAGAVAPGDLIQVQFDHIGAVGGDGGVFNVLLFGEGETEVSFTEAFDPRPVLGENWSTFTATFTIPDGADVSQGVSVLIETVCGGAEGCTVSANVDNVTITVNPE